MPQIALSNIAFGFLVVFISSLLGAFVSWDTTQALMDDPNQVNAWMLTIMRASHGHFNLFGILHILFGITLPYSVLSARKKLIQTYALAGGTIAMGPVMWLYSLGVPSREPGVFSIIIGVAMVFALTAVISHSGGVFVKVYQRN